MLNQVIHYRGCATLQFKDLFNNWLNFRLFKCYGGEIGIARALSCLGESYARSNSKPFAFFYAEGLGPDGQLYKRAL